MDSPHDKEEKKDKKSAKEKQAEKVQAEKNALKIKLQNYQVSLDPLAPHYRVQILTGCLAGCVGVQEGVVRSVLLHEEDSQGVTITLIPLECTLTNQPPESNLLPHPLSPSLSALPLPLSLPSSISLHISLLLSLSLPLSLPPPPHHLRSPLPNHRPPCPQNFDHGLPAPPMLILSFDPQPTVQGTLKDDRGLQMALDPDADVSTAPSA